jgi:hypothetical protein
MAELNQDFTNTVYEDEEISPSFEEEMKRRVRDDFNNAKQFLTRYHKSCQEVYETYHNSGDYENLRKKNRFPVPFLQHQVDVATSYMMDKLWYKGRPCTVVGREETDKKDASAKQDMLAWQDYKDKMYSKLKRFVKSAFMYRIAVAQVDYTRIVKKQVVGKVIPIPGMESIEGAPQMSTVGVDEQEVYRGATVKWIDPVDFFITEDKSTMDDEHPVMIRSRHPFSYFRDKKNARGEPFFVNVDKLKASRADPRSSGGEDIDAATLAKRRAHDLEAEQNAHRNDVTYVEWQGEVNKIKLYEYLGYKTEIEHVHPLSGATNYEPICEPDEVVGAICGLANDTTIVRLEDSPFDAEGPNIIVGVIEEDESELLGTSLADKIRAIQKAKNVLMGMHLENFKQSVNAQHVVKTNALKSGASLLVNDAGGVIETTENVNDVHKRIEQPRVSPDIHILDEKFTQMGQDADGVQDVIYGKSEPGAETLGEVELTAGQSAIRMNTYLNSFEESFVAPLYSLRNQINMQYLDMPYVYGIIGESAIEWRKMEPGQIRANVDFICESSSRETNRLVISQQILQLLKFVPDMIAAGFPTRLDKLVQDLVEKGFSWRRERAEEIWPSLKLEAQGIDIDQMLVENMLLQLNMQKFMTLMGGMMPGGNGGPSPQPRSEGEARDSLNESNRTQVGRE